MGRRFESVRGLKNLQNPLLLLSGQTRYCELRGEQGSTESAVPVFPAAAVIGESSDPAYAEADRRLALS